MKNVAVDVDDVLAEFTPHVFNFLGKQMPEKLDYWSVELMAQLLEPEWFRSRVALDRGFWLNLPILSRPEDIKFNIKCYISSFPADLYRSRLGWLISHRFPTAPLVCSSDKISVCRQYNVDVLVDDKPQMMKDLQGTEILGLHYITPYAGFEPVGQHITNIKQVEDYL